MSSPTTPATTPAETQQPAESRSTLKPIPPKSAAEKRGDEMFGDDDSQSTPVADSFGVRDWRSGKGGKSRNSGQRERAPQPAKKGDGSVSSSATPASEEGAARADASTASPSSPELAPDNDPSSEMEEIEVAGRTWRVPKLVAENHRAKNGQFKAFERRAREGVASAEGWKAHAESLQAQLDAARAGQSQVANPQTAVSPASQKPPVSSATPGEPKPLLESVDWDTYEQLLTHNPRVAQQWLAENTETVINARLAHTVASLEAKLLERFAPVLQNQQQNAEFNRAADFFQQMAGTSDESGHWYPELHSDADAVAEIAQIWKSIPDETFRFSPLAFHQSYLTWKDYKARQSRAQGMNRGVVAPTPPAPPNSQSPSPASLFPPEDTTRAQSVISGASGSPRPTAPSRGQGSRQQEILDAIGNAAPVDPIFKIRRR